MLPSATESVRRNETSQSAKSSREQMQQLLPLFDHLVGSRKQCRWNEKVERSGGFLIDH
jgi:hypothetical protein